MCPGVHAVARQHVLALALKPVHGLFLKPVFQKDLVLGGLAARPHQQCLVRPFCRACNGVSANFLYQLPSPSISAIRTCTSGVLYCPDHPRVESDPCSLHRACQLCPGLLPAAWATFLTLLHKLLKRLASPRLVMCDLWSDDREVNVC